jgi:chemotaxis signal transduction protein
LDSSPTAAEPVGERLLVAHIGVGRFAFRLGSVREIVPLPPMTPLPGAPAAVLGITNVRGRVVTVIDGGRRWSVPTAVEGGTLLVVAFEGRWLGVRVDDVDRVEVLDTSRAAAGDAEVRVMPDGESGPLHVVDVAVLLQQVLRDRGEVKP